MVTRPDFPNKPHMTRAFFERCDMVTRASVRCQGGIMRPTTHSTVLIAALIGVAACDKNAPTAAPPTTGTPAPGFVVVPASLGTALPSLDAAQRLRFDAGRAVFTTVFTPQTGLGPLFNSVGCANCHEQPVVGGGGNNDPAEGSEDIELHATAFHGAERAATILRRSAGRGFKNKVQPPSTPPRPSPPDPSPPRAPTPALA